MTRLKRVRKILLKLVRNEGKEIQGKTYKKSLEKIHQAKRLIQEIKTKVK